jgi:hypothetical protein
MNAVLALTRYFHFLLSSGSSVSFDFGQRKSRKNSDDRVLSGFASNSNQAQP